MQQVLIRATLKIAALGPLMAAPREYYLLGLVWTGIYGISSLVTADHLVPHDVAARTTVVLER
jgi:hypothetical protein